MNKLRMPTVVEIVRFGKLYTTVSLDATAILVLVSLINIASPVLLGLGDIAAYEMSVLAIVAGSVGILEGSPSRHLVHPLFNFLETVVTT